MSSRFNFRSIGAMTIVALSFSAPSFANTNQATMKSGKADKSQVMSMIQNWPDTSKKAATAMIEKYGAPDESTQSMLLWNKNGPWKRTIVSREEITHNFPKAHKDVLEQVIDMKVPPEKFSDLAAFDGSVVVERTKGEISARCDMEEANNLALNLARDIISGKRSVADARQFYSQTITALQSGKKDPYTQKLQFAAAGSDTADPDRAMPAQAAGISGDDSSMPTEDTSGPSDSSNVPVTPDSSSNSQNSPTQGGSTQ